MTRASAIAFVVVIVMGGIFVVTRQHHYRCTEDMPCWNCHTMGNLVCGKGK